ncbi:MAG: DNA polymerase III subunit chi [Roseobacter sp.]
MGTALFYHLTRKPVEQTLPMLLEKSLAAGMRVVVRGTDEARLDWLDEKLWVLSDDSFLPHGRAGGAHDPDQPILLTTGAEVPNAATCLMSVDNAEVTPEDARQMERVCVLFDGHDEQALSRARSQWAALKEARIKAQYWSEESGRWEKKAET